MKRVVVVGSNGLLGEACVRVFAEHGMEVLAFTRAEMDLCCLNQVSQKIRGIDYDALVYTAAVSSLERCLAEPDEARLVNVDAAQLLARDAHEKSAKMIYVSTDYVFDGERDGRLLESDDAKPVNVYGQTKLAGEQAVMAQNPAALVCRVSWLFGRGRASFVDQVLDTAAGGGLASYIADKFSVPNYCDDVALGMLDLLRTTGVAGIVHMVCDADPESWHSYAQKVVQCAQSLGMLKSTDYQLAATRLADADFFKDRRPQHTAMLPDRLAREFRIQLNHWESGLREFLLWKRDHGLTKSRN